MLAMAFMPHTYFTFSKQLIEIFGIFSGSFRSFFSRDDFSPIFFFSITFSSYLDFFNNRFMVDLIAVHWAWASETRYTTYRLVFALWRVIVKRQSQLTSSFRIYMVSTRATRYVYVTIHYMQICNGKISFWFDNIHINLHLKNGYHWIFMSRRKHNIQMIFGLNKIVRNIYFI